MLYSKPDLSTRIPVGDSIGAQSLHDDFGVKSGVPCDGSSLGTSTQYTSAASWSCPNRVHPDWFSSLPVSQARVVSLFPHLFRHGPREDDDPVDTTDSLVVNTVDEVFCKRRTFKQVNYYCSEGRQILCSTSSGVERIYVDAGEWQAFLESVVQDRGLFIEVFDETGKLSLWNLSKRENWSAPPATPTITIFARNRFGNMCAIKELRNLSVQLDQRAEGAEAVTVQTGSFTKETKQIFLSGGRGVSGKFVSIEVRKHRTHFKSAESNDVIFDSAPQLLGDKADQAYVKNVEQSLPGEHLILPSNSNVNDVAASVDSGPSQSSPKARGRTTKGQNHKGAIESGAAKLAKFNASAEHSIRSDLNGSAEKSGSPVKPQAGRRTTYTLKDLIEITGYQKSTINSWMCVSSRGYIASFPLPFKMADAVNARANRWDAVTFDAWWDRQFKSRG